MNFCSGFCHNIWPLPLHFTLNEVAVDTTVPSRNAPPLPLCMRPIIQNSQETPIGFGGKILHTKQSRRQTVELCTQNVTKHFPPLGTVRIRIHVEVLLFSAIVRSPWLPIADRIEKELCDHHRRWVNTTYCNSERNSKRTHEQYTCVRCVKLFRLCVF